MPYGSILCYLFEKYIHLALFFSSVAGAVIVLGMITVRHAWATLSGPGLMSLPLHGLGKCNCQLAGIKQCCCQHFAYTSSGASVDGTVLLFISRLQCGFMGGTHENDIRPEYKRLPVAH